MASPTTHLRQLVNLISESVDKIEQAYNARSEPLPSLESTDPRLPEVAFEPDVLKATAALTAACTQLQHTVQPQTTQIFHSASAHHLSACLNVAIRTHAAEALRSAGDKGLHVRDIAKFSPIQPEKLARCLRMLASHYIFREVAPDVFANNRLSVQIDTGKDAEILRSQDLKAVPSCAHAPPLTFGFSPCSTEFQFNIAAKLPETILDPHTADSTSVDNAAVTRVTGQKLGMFDWLMQPEQSKYRSIFNNAMVGVEMYNVPEFILHEDIGWKNLPAGSVVVDVAAGVGTHSLIVARAHPHLRVIVEDLPATIEQAKDYWKTNLPEAVSSGRVEFQSYDFFQPNAVNGAAVYFCRQTIHNWPDKEAVQILKQMAEAADESSRIVIIGHVMLPACREQSSSWSFEPAPEPLLANYGMASRTAYVTDIIMMGTFNAVSSISYPPPRANHISLVSSNNGRALSTPSS
ncbi:S-adenosyl-L-methionine-dependent methyltransferase [Gloeophyllum trabeum ATCC 11539]|uniref:S-adenosyl-L-methionine-dependent methyltransferase n=1 Tax=Gloeophyllum trabeum (strain ATCC 11539 / FP-39264 / Madison 617) TaxID=670483 RepID=S7RHV0_GLOTA|nr:S-adenosyl-L-methionine-dependent methyltransferase [Gloeophyllum trabeum ATCC 11539]EPQ52174.1 S-adenosyl-L-methionine-dependent methyltransferase [Gloeophyllum trabeum ATCC 11539]